MDCRATIINVGGKEVYLVDYSGIRNAQQFKEAIRETGAYRERLVKSGKCDLLLLVDVTGSELNLEIYEKLRKHGVLTKPITCREAVVGMEKFRFIVQTYNLYTGMDFRMFDKREDALVWLVGQQLAANG